MIRRYTSFFLDRVELAVKVAVENERGSASDTDVKLLAAVNRLSEQNPMLGLRGVRLGLVLPGLFAMQVEALTLAACDQKRAGRNPKPEVMIPLVGSIAELSHYSCRSEQSH